MRKLLQTVPRCFVIAFFELILSQPKVLKSCTDLRSCMYDDFDTPREATIMLDWKIEKHQEESSKDQALGLE